MTSTSPTTGADGFLAGVRVLEIGGELGEYCGKFLAGLGADVIKVEPPEGEATRSFGPFYEDGSAPGEAPGLEHSLYFWHYNFGKRGVTLDLDSAAGQQQFRALAQDADIILDARPPGYLADRGLSYDALKAINPRLIFSRISPFGDEGPWGEFKSSDLVHLALGGMMNNCGYDPEPSGEYETPPIAPQMWQSYHVAGEMAAMGILGALYHRTDSGKGQYLSTAVHSAMAQATERDIPSWTYLHQLHLRQTCRHSSPIPSSPVLAQTKDGRWIFPYNSYAHAGSGLQDTINILAKYGMAEDLLDEKYKDPKYTAQKTVEVHVSDVVARFVNRFKFDKDVWRIFQAAGLTWAPVRRPEENAEDEHWLIRKTFFEVERPELGRSFMEVGARWVSPQVPWRAGPRSPLLGEHNSELLGGLVKEPAPIAAAAPAKTNSSLHKPLALDGVKFLDLGWLVASAGGGRFLAALGAEVVKVEHKSRWDGMRLSQCIAPEGGRAERDAATGPLPNIRPKTMNSAGFFADINAGKRAISLNLKHPRGKEVLTDLIKAAHVVGEGFSPGTMDRMGFGYDRLKEINPSIVYCQQSGTGQAGTYGAMRSYGPVAQAFSGLSEMSGLPEPYPPAGIGYSYLDWFGAYNMVNGILAGLYRQKTTGQGCWIDTSQVDVGIYLNGTAILDHSANGRRWTRYGNRSPYKLAAPNGAFRTQGNDRWVALSCFTEEEWHGLLGVFGSPAWGSDPRFATLTDRLAHQDELEALVSSATAGFEPYALMEALQARGVPAGVCQTSEDRCEVDPQLKAMNWLIELPQTEIGTWRTKDFPVRLSETPAPVGGPIQRHGPNYAEDNEYIYGEWLGFSSAKIKELESEDII